MTSALFRQHPRSYQVFFLLDPHKPVSTFPPQLWRAQLAVKGQQPAGVVNEGNSINVVTAYAVWKMVGEALGL